MTEINGKKLKLIVVDDMEEICEYMQSHFRKRGYVVFTAKSGEDALPIIKEQSPDIMLLDMNLPRMSGLDLLKLVRVFNSRIKVIMITGYDIDFQNDPQFKGLNVFDVMPKPVSFEALDANIAKVIE